MDGLQLHQFFEWAGAITGVSGTYIIAQKKWWSKYAWPVWIFSNFCLIGFALLTQAWGIFSMQLVFLALNAQGAWKWLRD